MIQSVPLSMIFQAIQPNQRLDRNELRTHFQALRPKAVTRCDFPVPGAPVKIRFSFPSIKCNDSRTLRSSCGGNLI